MFTLGAPLWIGQQRWTALLFPYPDINPLYIDGSTPPLSPLRREVEEREAQLLERKAQEEQVYREQEERKRRDLEERNRLEEGRKEVMFHTVSSICLLT